VAVTLSLALRVTVQVVLPLHAPPQLAKYELTPALEVKVTWVPGGNVAVHELPHVMPEGLLVTVPVPVPPRLTFNVAAVRLNAAPTAVLLLTVTVHEAVPAHVPDQPANAEFVPAVAVRVTWVPGLNPAIQEVPQLIPAGALVTVPRPFPDRLTVRESGVTLNAAPKEVLPVSVIAQELWPVQAPDQPAKVELVAALAVSVTWVPEGNVALHVDPQLMPAGLLVMVPVPLPES